MTGLPIAGHRVGREHLPSHDHRPTALRIHGRVIVTADVLRVIVPGLVIAGSHDLLLNVQQWPGESGVWMDDGQMTRSRTPGRLLHRPRQVLLRVTTVARPGCLTSIQGAPAMTVRPG